MRWQKYVLEKFGARRILRLTCTVTTPVTSCGFQMPGEVHEKLNAPLHQTVDLGPSATIRTVPNHNFRT